ncbi:MAG: c-type cytochrome, partial [Hydrogenophilaceae bacterium]|nr:c-type cytochrome [Hydrogenophilaceae bacterium]
APPRETAPQNVVAHGRTLYATYCGTCHGDAAVSAGLYPDLRYAAALGDAGVWRDTVIGGARAGNGMASFDEALSESDSEAIRAFLIWQANADRAAGADAPP